MIMVSVCTFAWFANVAPTFLFIFLVLVATMSFFFFSGMFAFVPVLHALLSTFKDAANYRGPKTAALYSKLAILMAVTWSAYPIIWAVGEGSQVFGRTGLLVVFKIRTSVELTTCIFLLLVFRP